MEPNLLHTNKNGKNYVRIGIYAILIGITLPFHIKNIELPLAIIERQNYGDIIYLIRGKLFWKTKLMLWSFKLAEPRLKLYGWRAEAKMGIVDEQIDLPINEFKLLQLRTKQKYY